MFSSGFFRHCIIGVLSLVFIGSASNAGGIFSNLLPNRPIRTKFNQLRVQRANAVVRQSAQKSSFYTQQQCVNGNCYPSQTYYPAPSWQPQAVTYQPVARPLPPTVFAPEPVVVRAPVQPAPLPAPKVVATTQPAPANASLFFETSIKPGFKRELIRAVRQARVSGKVNARQAIRLRVACNSPAFLKSAEDLCVTQMAFSEDGEVLERGQNGEILRTAIDWEGFAAFLERIIPLLVDLLTQFGAI